MTINFKQMKSKVDEVYTPRAPAEKNFAAKHVVHIEPDPWNKDQKWPNSGVKGKSKTNKASRQPGEDEKVYEEFTAEEISEVVQEMIAEVLGKNAKAGDWISDFVHSKNPKFKGKSKKERMKQALAAYYSKQRNEEVESVPSEENALIEAADAVTVRTSNHHWGKMMTVHHRSSHSYPLHPEHQEAIRKLKDGEKARFEDETGNRVTAHREGDKVHLSSKQTGGKTTIAHGHFKESLDEGLSADYAVTKEKLPSGQIVFKKEKKKVNEETIDEAKRGRPKKSGESSENESEEGGDSHPIMQLRKVVSTRGQKHMVFKSGEKKEVHPTHAHKVMQMHDNAKTAEQKQEIADRAGKSHQSFKDLVAGKAAEPKKPKITLAKFAGKK